MSDGKTPGDGKTSPFGKNGGPMPGNDFNKNPAGSAPGGRGVNFLEQPSGGGGGSAPKDPLVSAVKGDQKSGTDEANPQSEIKSDGGPGLRPDATVPAGSPRQQFIGTGSIGDSRKPFKGI